MKKKLFHTSLLGNQLKWFQFEIVQMMNSKKDILMELKIVPPKQVFDDPHKQFTLTPTTQTTLITMKIKQLK
jgi:hypothetical protein